MTSDVDEVLARGAPIRTSELRKRPGLGVNVDLMRFHSHYFPSLFQHETLEANNVCLYQVEINYRNMFGVLF